MLWLEWPPALPMADPVYPDQLYYKKYKSLPLYIPPSSPAFHQQRQQSPTIIHSPIPIPIPADQRPIHHPYLVHYSPAYSQPYSFDAPFYSPPQPSFQPTFAYPADPTYEYPITEQSYCDPQFVSSAVPDKPDTEPDDEWAARVHYLVPEQPVPSPAADPDMDADGEDDLESHHHPDIAPQRGDSHPWVESVPAPAPAPEPVQDDFEDEDEDDLESEDDDDDDEDDTRDPEFTLRRTRRRRRTSTALSCPSSSSYPLQTSRTLRSGRYNPYPSSPSYSASPTDVLPADYILDQHDHFSSSTTPPLRPRRAYHNHNHTSVSPSTSEPYSPVSVSATSTSTSTAARRRARPTTSLPIPIPVPNLTKKSRGRRVPTMEDFKDDMDVSPAVPPNKGKKKGPGTGAANNNNNGVGTAKSMRTYTCDVDGCGKLFARGEHLKRHIRSIHTYEKRESSSRCSVLSFAR